MEQAGKRYEIQLLDSINDRFSSTALRSSLPPAVAQLSALADSEIGCAFVLDEMNPALLDVFLAAFYWAFSSRVPLG